LKNSERIKKKSFGLENMIFFIEPKNFSEHCIIDFFNMDLQRGQVTKPESEDKK